MQKIKPIYPLLKGSKEVDIVKKLLSTEICQKCGDCCKHFPLVDVSENEIASLKLLTGLCFESFLDSKGKASDGYFLQFKENGHCFFLNKKNGRYFCEIYQNRPKICKNYPSTLRQNNACHLNMEKTMHHLP